MNNNNQNYKNIDYKIVDKGTPYKSPRNNQMQDEFIKFSNDSNFIFDEGSAKFPNPNYMKKPNYDVQITLKFKNINKIKETKDLPLNALPKDHHELTLYAFKSFGTKALDLCKYYLRIVENQDNSGQKKLRNYTTINENTDFNQIYHTGYYNQDSESSKKIIIKIYPPNHPEVNMLSQDSLKNMADDLGLIYDFTTDGVKDKKDDLTKELELNVDSIISKYNNAKSQVSLLSSTIDIQNESNFDVGINIPGNNENIIPQNMLESELVNPNDQNEHINMLTDQLAISCIQNKDLMSQIATLKATEKRLRIRLAANQNAPVDPNLLYMNRPN